MNQKLSSKERLMLTINHSEPDRVPLMFPPWPLPLAPSPSYTRDRQVEYMLGLGIDVAARFDPPTFYPNAIRALGQDVTTRVWKECPSDEPYPILHKEYHTPAGTLSQVVRQTLDWPHGDDIPIITDFCIPRPRSIKYMIEEEKDVDALACLFRDPSEAEREEFCKEAEEMKRFADKHGVPVIAGGFGFVPLFAADCLGWLCGIENMLMAAYERPDWLRRLLDIVMSWNAKYIGLIAEAGGVDVIGHRAYYENSTFWSPKLHREFIVPILKQEIDLVHAAGAKFCYIAVEGAMPLLGNLKEAGIDILFGLDPVEAAMDFKRIKEEIGNDICLWGGVSEHGTLDSMDNQLIRKEVREAIEILAPGGGFILSAVDNMPALLWESTNCLIDEWRKTCAYPAGALTD